ncbi:MAG TPA: von Willebrand factor type A domain-containing protein, partial [Flavitalea sp.]|nr:von Willebrand factor type A domain-containing protein [Flavitalea sp.]
MKFKIIISFALLLVAMSFIKPQPFKVSGIVTDASTGLGLQSVSVTLKGSNTVTTTDNTGSFTITVNDEKSILIFTFPGYSIERRAAGDGKQKLHVSLTSSSGNMEEVVVIGYASQKKTVIVGSTTTKTLQGSAPGLLVNNYPKRRGREMEMSDRDMKHFDREGYDAITENGFKTVDQDPLSTFSIDVDAASYSNVRRMLNMGQLPPSGAVRIEEMINYFKYDYKAPVGDDPFSINTEIAACPWNNKHQLVSVGLQGKLIPTDNLPASNLVFLIDVSGSMMDENKLPLVQQSLKLLVDQLREKDRVALVVYAGSAGLVLPSTSGEEKIKIKDAIDRLQAGGSTAGGEGIQLAYKTAGENFIKSGNNRIILCSDGDFNVGVSSDAALETLIEKERKSGVFLTILGYGTGNYQD